MSETIEQQCQRVMEERGYLVITTRDTFRIGEVIPSTTDISTKRELNHPTVVIAETNAVDFAGHLMAFWGIIYMTTLLTESRFSDIIKT